jgi:glycine cleavage system H protein
MLRWARFKETPMLTPDDRRYSSDHTWAQQIGELVSTGITDHAQDELGDIVYIQIPDTGATVTRGSSMGEIESVKTVSDLVSPVTGVVQERNEGAIEKPEIVNSDPYGEGWLVRVRLSDSSELASLLSAADYQALTEAQH